METLTNEKILVIQTAFLGDAILTLPMIQKLNAINPASVIDVISIPSTSGVFSASPYVNKIYVLDKRGKHRGFKALNRFISELKKNKYSKLFSPHRSFRSAYITLKLRVKDSYGFDNSSFKYAFRYNAEYKISYHEVRRNLSLIGENTDDDNWKILPVVIVPDVSKEKLKIYINNRNLSKGFIAVAPGSVWKTKCYPKEYFIAILKSLASDNYKLILIGGENDKKICNEIADQAGRDVLVTAGEFSIVETIGLLKYAKLLVTNDSAPTHMGMCADIPVLTLYCSTVSRFGFYPYNDKSTFLSYDELDCKPCGIHGYAQCPIGSFDCALKLTPDFVLQKINDMLNTHE
ncbi:lipopolysaccharide core heptosyltransferase RfaQ [bacterium BMS3Abin03]|nr:lipopolysaccharide core heptosyltransferase RfaQ [bacterium BMS3Abin03]